MSDFPNKEIVNACVHNLSGSYFQSCLHASDEIVRIIGWKYRNTVLLPSSTVIAKRKSN